MEASSKDESKRLVFQTPESRDDLISIFVYNAHQYGEMHAERYVRLLADRIALLAEMPGLGRVVADVTGVRLYIIKSTGKRSAHGYQVFYREVKDGIEVIRILHTGLPWPS